MKLRRCSQSLRLCWPVGNLSSVVGLASQEAASNMINSFMIMTYKPYKIGDFVNVRI
ncbi:MAG: mechanosensitive ion channel domain-containing protein [Thomasclavelia ramosa]